MIQIEQKLELGRQSLVIGEETDSGYREDKKPSFREQMLLHNDIDGVLPFEIRCENGIRQLEYRTENMRSMESFCEKQKVGLKDLKGLLGGILRVLYHAREFMLLEDDFIIRKDTVFLDRQGKVRTTYYPGYGVCLREQLCKLAEYLMNRVNYHDDSAVLLTYSFYMKAKEETCTLEELFEIVNASGSISSGEEPGAAVTAVQSAGRIPEFSASTVQSADRIPEFSASAVQNAGRIPEFSASAVQSADRVSEFSGADRKSTDRFQESLGTTNQSKSAVRSTFETKEINPDDSLSKPEGDISRFWNNDVEEVENSVPSAGVVFRESPDRLKLVSLAIPLVILAAELLILRSGILAGEDASGIPLGRKLICVLAGLTVTAGAEIVIWKVFADKLTAGFKSAAEKAGEATVLLNGKDGIEYPFALVSEEYPSIKVSRFPYYIGKDETHVDYVLNLIGISRFHAKIDRDGEHFTVSDLNSTNGTFINGERLAPHMPRRVRRGDEVRLGNSVFYCN